ncbi:MAG TPA: hypothetical protein VKC61_04740 [Pyrinomonadaceae bacterium]|nr:hypothetical protein [Pyrinomonadaceae bacterium]
MKKAQLRKNADQRSRREKFLTIFVGALVLFMVAALVLLVVHKTNQRIDTGDYEGTIVDRWADYSESQQGSLPYFRLLVEGTDGKRFAVRVDSSVYESAKVGMRIKSRSGQIVLIDSDLRKAGSK